MSIRSPHITPWLVISLIYWCGNVIRAESAPQASSPKVEFLSGWSGSYVSYSRDGKRILTAGEDGARVWDAQTLKPISPAIEQGRFIVTAAFSEDGRRIFVATHSHARVWDVESGKPLSEPFVHGQTTDLIACIAPDFSRVLTASRHAPPASVAQVRPPRIYPQERLATLWDVATVKTITDVQTSWPATEAEFSPDGKRFALATDGTGSNGLRSIKLYDAASYKLIGPPLEFTAAARTDRPFAFSPDAKSFAVLADANAVEVRRCEDGFRTARIKTNSSYPPQALRFSPDISKLFCLVASHCDVDGDLVDYSDVHVWDVATNADLARPWNEGNFDPSRDFSFAAAISNDGKSIFVCADEKSLVLWDLAEGHRRFTLTGDEWFDYRDHIAFRPDDKQIALAHHGDHQTMIISLEK